MKRYLCLAALCCMVAMLSGCGRRIYLTINNDYTYSVKEEYLFSGEEELKEMVPGTENMGESITIGDMLDSAGATKDTVSIDGKEYIRYSILDESDEKITENQGLFVEFNSKRAVMNTLIMQDISGIDGDEAEESISGEELEIDEFYITFPYKVKYASGKIQKDGYTVKFDISDSSAKRIYASFISEKNSNAGITFKGVKNSKWYKKDLENVQVISDDIITEFKVDGEMSLSNDTSIVSDGKHTLEAKTASGKTKKITVWMDKTAPKVNVSKKTYKKNVTIKFSDKTSGIKSATLNGKTIKNGTKVTKNGAYTLKVKDKAENTKVVKFNIKK